MHSVPLAEPPEGALVGESVPRENEAEDYERMYDEIKAARLNELERQEAAQEGAE